MPRPVPRRLTLADMAMLIVGIALGMWLLRFSQETLALSFTSGSVMSAGHRATLAYEPFCLALAASLMAVRAIKPRPRWRVVFRQPGTSACLAILAHMLFVVLIFSWHSFLVPRLGLANFRPHFNTYLFANFESGAWVGVSWATLALSGALRPEPSWIDRSGRFLGVLAILLRLGLGLVW